MVGEFLRVSPSEVEMKFKIHLLNIFNFLMINDCYECWLYDGCGEDAEYYDIDYVVICTYDDFKEYYGI